VCKHARPLHDTVHTTLGFHLYKESRQ
jgi:hypothetical protein